MADFKEIQIGENGQVYQVKDETARQNAGSGDGTVTGVKVGSTTYPPNDEGVVDLSTPMDAKVDKNGTDSLMTAAEHTKLQNLPTADQLTQQLGTKANDNAVVKSVTINGVQKTPQSGNVSFDVQAGETVVINSDGANIVDSQSDSILTAPSSRMVKEIYLNLQKLFDPVNGLANIAFVGTRPTWQSVAIPTHTITLGTMTNVDASLNGTAINGSTSATEGEVTILLSPTSNNYMGSISVKDASNNDVAFTQTDVAGGTEITFILSGNVTISASASSGIEVNVSGTGITSYTTGVQPNTAAQLTIALPEHHTWGTVTVSYGGTDITSQCTISQANNADKVITLPNNLSDMSKSISIVANTVEDAHVTITINGSNFVVKQGNTQLSNNSKVYNGSAAQTLTIEPASGYKFSTLPSADKGTMTNNGYYEASSLEIGTSVEDTLTITAAGSLLNQNCQITLPSTGNGIASVALTDLAGTSITSPVVEGTGIKIALTPDTDYTISTISIANMTEGTDYNVTDNNGVKTITIEHVTGNVAVSATATLQEPFSVQNNLNKCTNDNQSSNVMEGESYSATISPQAGYVLKSVTVNGVAQTISNNSCAISIASVDNDINIIAEAVVNIVTGKYIGSQNNGELVESANFGYTEGVLTVDKTHIRVTHNAGLAYTQNGPCIYFHKSISPSDIKANAYWNEKSNSGAAYSYVSNDGTVMTFNKGISGAAQYTSDYLRFSPKVDNGSFEACRVEISDDRNTWVDVFNGATAGSYAVDGVIYYGND